MNRDSTVLIVDDEPEYLGWVEEFLANNELEVRYATNLSEALEAIGIAGQDRFRLVLIDMNIPAPTGLSDKTMEEEPLAQRYPGLLVVSTCRNLGYGAHAVVAYTVHDDDTIDAALQKVHCRYVLKGRPEVLKRVIRGSLDSQPGQRREKTDGANR